MNQFSSSDSIEVNKHKIIHEEQNPPSLFSTLW